MILIDNYDSFTYNIVQYLKELGVQPKIFENDKITVEELKSLDFERIIISPGAGNPDTAGISLDVIKEFHKSKKILGICLGHQCIAQFFGGQIIKSANPIHGKTSQIYFDENCRIFNGLKQGFYATRYHSLETANLPDVLKITAQTKDKIIMAIEHKTYPIYGVQFHPEAVLTEYGHEMLKNFITL
ncbi:anthranilate synthase component II [Clostridium sp. CAG:967]|nr:anthranilate synthase component II [Clostridium sp. CAG:967]